MAMYTELSDALHEIDTKLDSRDGGTSGLKSQVIGTAVEAAKDNWSVVSDSIVSQLSDTPPEVQIGFYYGLIRSLDKVYGDSAKKFVDEQIASAPKVEPLITEAEVPALLETRKDVYGKIKAVMGMAETFGDDDFQKMENPRRRGGAPKGKRGARAISFFTFTVVDSDGNETEYDKLRDVVDAVPAYDKVAELTKAIRAAGINLTTPPARWEFDLPDGRTLIGVGPETDEEDDPEDEEDNSEEE